MNPIICFQTLLTDRVFIQVAERVKVCSRERQGKWQMSLRIAPTVLYATVHAEGEWQPGMWQTVEFLNFAMDMRILLIESHLWPNTFSHRSSYTTFLGCKKCRDIYYKTNMPVFHHSRAANKKKCINRSWSRTHPEKQWWLQPMLATNGAMVLCMLELLKW